MASLASAPFPSIFDTPPALVPPQKAYAVADCETTLPRSVPFVGFLRHAPQRVLHEKFDLLLRRRSKDTTKRDASSWDDAHGSQVKLLGVNGTHNNQNNPDAAPLPLALPRASPYVGFQRHSPPSPLLAFSEMGASPFFLGAHIDEGGDEDAIVGLEVASASNQAAHIIAEQELPFWHGGLPEEVWTSVLAAAIEVPTIGQISNVSRMFTRIARTELAWYGAVVTISPRLLQALAPRLDMWLQYWRGASQLVIPNSSQLLAEIKRKAPGIPVQLAWRFSKHLKGAGVEVLRDGLVVRRVSDEELVVLGDAPLPNVLDKAPYFEVRLDERGECIGDGLNDFGLGVTTCELGEITELGGVADEVPGSCVVDFTQCSVVLSVNNRQAAIGRCLNAGDLHVGDRLGLRIMPQAVEVFINGVLRERLVPVSGECVPLGVGLYPILDLYGRAVQVSKTDSDEPRPQLISCAKFA